MNKRIIMAAPAAIALAAWAALTPAPRKALPAGPYVNAADTVSVSTPKGTVEVFPLSADIFRVTVIPTDSTLLFSPSQGAILVPEEGGVPVHTLVDRDSVVVATASTRAVIDRHSGNVTFRNAGGRLLMTEAGGVNNTGPVKTVSLLATPGQRLYGAGERGHRTTLEGDTLTFYNRQNYGYTDSDPRISQMGISVPWISSDAGYGVLFDDYSKASATLGTDSLVYRSETPKPLSYFFVNGHGDLAGNSAALSRLTGRQDLPPFWSLGYITSKYGYHNRQEALGAIDSLKRRGYPLDGIVLDLYWYGKETDMGRLAWDKSQWPDHRAMLDSMRRMHVNLIPISQPYINKTGALDNYNLLDSLGLLTHDADGNTHDVTTWVGDAGMFDVANPDTRDWLWRRLRPLTEEGLAGWWGDLGEPEVHPATIVHANGETAEQFHNVYGNIWSKLIYDGLRADFPQMRPVLLMRGGTTGLQRYSVLPWTTDVSRSWGGLKPQVKLMLHSGLSGLGYMSSDIGGFAVDPEHPIDPELYVRWLEMGVFTPVLRTHAQQKPEPYHYPQYEKYTLPLIKMRYEWLPYNYTLAYENASQGLPLARPLNFRGDNPEARAADIADEYLWGDNVLVAPVMKAGASSRSVYFPTGEWINWHNPVLRYRGGTSATVKAPLGQLPLFVRAGTFIPQYTRPIANVSEYDPTFLTVKYFPSARETSYTLFDDDRLSTTSLQDHAYQLTTFRGSMKQGRLQLEISTDGGSYAGMPQGRMLTIEVVGVARKPAKVSVEGAGQELTQLPAAASPKAIRQYGYAYDATSRTLTLRLPFAYAPLRISAK